MMTLESADVYMPPKKKKKIPKMGKNKEFYLRAQLLRTHLD